MAAGDAQRVGFRKCHEFAERHIRWPVRRRQLATDARCPIAFARRLLRQSDKPQHCDPRCAHRTNSSHPSLRLHLPLGTIHFIGSVTM